MHYTYQAKYPQHVQVRVNGYGTSSEKGAAKKDVVMSINGREIQRRKVEIRQIAAATVIFDPFELAPGLSRGEIRVTPGDDFPSDDVRYFTVERREPYKILFLSGGADRGLLYFRQALAAGDDPAFTVDARSSASSVNGYAMVVLFNFHVRPRPD